MPLSRDLNSCGNLDQTFSLIKLIDQHSDTLRFSTSKKVPGSCIKIGQVFCVSIHFYPLDLIRGMGRRSKSREVSKERLGPDFSEDEANFYRKYFRKLGGKKRDFLERSQVEQFLQRSELGQEILDEILKISIQFGETVDFEAFCVACRLVAHAQELGLVQVEQVALVPSNVPWFSEPAEKEVEASFQTVQEVQVEEPEFDFEGVALGVNAEAFSGPSTFLQRICLNVQKFFNLIALCNSMQFRACLILVCI